MALSLQFLAIVLVVGAGAGWIADRLATGKGFGTAGDAVVGVIGAFAGVWAARHFGVAVMPGNAGLVIHAAAGAIVLLALARVSQGGFSLGSKADAPAKPAAAKKAAAPVAEGPRPVRPEPRTGR
jgi:uncharacterized membrane protein YeaQ/YmgE (transglycosylase-associated protein family)